MQIYLFTAIKIEQRIAGVLKPSSRTMFTPPPSPLRLPLQPERLSMDEKSFSNSESVLEVEGNEAEMSARSMVSLDLQKKKGIGRRVRWIVVLVPIVLILVAFSTHLASSSSPFLMHNAPGNLETWQPEHDNIFSSSFHKRTPSPQSQPQALTISNTVSASRLSTNPSGTQSNSATPTTSISQTSQTIPPAPPASAPPVLPTPFPQPFDSVGATTNLSTSSCQTFFQNMTQADDFRKCRPLSLLLQYGSAFFEVSFDIYHSGLLGAIHSRCLLDC